MTSNSIIQKAIQGDANALNCLYNRYVDEMYSSSFRIINDIHAAEDIIQESFEQSFDKLSTLKDITNYQGWLRRIVINKSLAFLKRKKLVFDTLPVSIIEEDDNEEWYMGIGFEAIKNAIQNLPVGARTVFSLYAIEGYKHREIAEIQDISIATSKTQYRYAKQLLRVSLTKQYKDEI